MIIFFFLRVYCEDSIIIHKHNFIAMNFIVCPNKFFFLLWPYLVSITYCYLAHHKNEWKKTSQIAMVSENKECWPKFEMNSKIAIDSNVVDVCVWLMCAYANPMLKLKWDWSRQRFDVKLIRIIWMGSKVKYFDFTVAFDWWFIQCYTKDFNTIQNIIHVT